MFMLLLLLPPGATAAVRGFVVMSAAFDCC
jgi:hypothetical protein